MNHCFTCVRLPTSLRYFIIVLIGLPLATSLRAGTIVVSVNEGITVDKALASTEKEPKTTLPGKVQGHTITFDNASPGTAYEVQLVLNDGTVLQGVDMSWYSRVPDRKDADPLSDDDIAQMKAVFTAGSQFFNVQQAILIKGNHNRAVMLTLQQRDTRFHSDTGDQIIWRPELWYFENHHGGWEKVPQTDRVLRREKFTDSKSYHDVVDHLKWVPELGGLKVTPSSPEIKIAVPATQPSDQPNR